MSWFWYIILGAASGWLTQRLLKRESKGFLRNLLLGAAGGFVGSRLLKLVGMESTSKMGFILTAVLGGVIVVWIADKIRDSENKKK